MTQATSDPNARLDAVEAQQTQNNAEVAKLLAETAISVRSAIQEARKNTSGGYRTDCAPETT